MQIKPVYLSKFSASFWSQPSYLTTKPYNSAVCKTKPNYNSTCIYKAEG